MMTGGTPILGNLQFVIENHCLNRYQIIYKWAVYTTAYSHSCIRWRLVMFRWIGLREDLGETP